MSRVRSCHKLKEAAEEANEESALARNRSTQIRERAAMWEGAAEAMRKYEEEEARVLQMTCSPDAPFELQLGSAMTQKGVRPADLVAKWDVRGKGSLSKVRLACARCAVATLAGAGGCLRLASRVPPQCVCAVCPVAREECDRTIGFAVSPSSS